MLVVGEFSHRRVSGSAGFSCVARVGVQVVHGSRWYVEQSEVEEELHLPCPTVMHEGEVDREVE